MYVFGDEIMTFFVTDNVIKVSNMLLNKRISFYCLCEHKKAIFEGIWLLGVHRKIRQEGPKMITKLRKILKGRDFFEKIFGHDFFEKIPAQDPSKLYVHEIYDPPPQKKRAFFLGGGMFF